MTFDRAFALTIGEEGGLSNNPFDKGGMTYRGMQQRQFSAFLKAHDWPDKPVWEASEKETLLFYLGDAQWPGYWYGAHCPMTPELTGCFHFDSAVQHGPANAIRLLQQALGVEVDGNFGPHTLGVLSAADDRTVLAAYFAARKDFYAHIVASTPSQAIFWQGWMNRLDHLKKALA